MLLIINM